METSLLSSDRQPICQLDHHYSDKHLKISNKYALEPINYINNHIIVVWCIIQAIKCFIWLIFIWNDSIAFGCYFILLAFHLIKFTPKNYHCIWFNIIHMQTINFDARLLCTQCTYPFILLLCWQCNIHFSVRQSWSAIMVSSEL